MTSRPAILHLDESADGDRARVVLTLIWDDEQYSGESAGNADPEQRPRLVGEATLRAIEAVAGGSIRLELEAVATAPLGPVRVAMAQVRMSGSNETLVGNAVVDEDDPSLAAVKAVLDAINRRLGAVL